MRFSGTEYIRVDSYKHKLKDYPGKERALWRLFERTSFEDGLADDGLTDEQVIQLLNWHRQAFRVSLSYRRGSCRSSSTGR